jgi:Uma2 family endonuclease
MSLASRIEKKFAYTDYVTWPDDERWEIIGGEAWDMTPAPSTTHQRIAGRIYSRLEAALVGKLCTAFMAPTDVVLSEYDVVQPDVLVVCDEKKITKDNIQGVPDLVVEVLSPTTARKDRREKKTLYERSGLKEYLLIDPDGQYVERFRMEADGTFGKGEILAPQEALILGAIEGVEIPLWDVFEVKREEPHTETLS